MSTENTPTPPIPCVVVAGGVPQPDDPLYAYTQGKPKALIDVGGRAMLERIVDALQTARTVGDVVVAGLENTAGLHFRRPVHCLPNQGSLVGNAKAGLTWVRDRLETPARVSLLCSADIPHVTGPIVDDVVALCQPLDHLFYYTVVTPSVIERRYPAAGRTYLKLKGGLRIAGGDVHVVNPAVLDTDEALWKALTNARKHGWKLARVIGIGTLIKFLLRRLSLDDLAALGERALGYRGRVKVVMCPHAEVAMDGDKPHQIELLRATLAE